MRPIRVIVVFAAGIAAGFLLARITDRSGAEATAPPIEADLVMPSAPDSYADAPRPPAPAPVRAASPPAAAAPTASTTVAMPDAEYGGYTQPVDAGPVFQKLMSQKPPPGADNRLGDLHRALERESRDDSWAYPMEAEIQNSLVAETSAGRLSVEHLECRATLCELRLSGNVANEQSLTDWTAATGKQPWASRLYMNLSSSISDGERVDSLLIFRRPAQ
jgi:hypothetical protein